jgi:hypothetical protein
MAPSQLGRQLSRQRTRTLCAAAVEAAARGAPARSAVITSDPANNVSDYIYSKMGVNLHQQPSHPIGIIKQAIYTFFEQQHPGVFKTFDDLYPIVTTTANFDEVLVPAGGLWRRPEQAAGGAGPRRAHASAAPGALRRRRCQCRGAGAREAAATAA